LDCIQKILRLGKTVRLQWQVLCVTRCNVQAYWPGIVSFCLKNTLLVNRLFRRDRRGRRGGGVALYIKKALQSEELSLKNNHEQVESLWVRTGERDNKRNLVVGVYYRPPDQEELIDEVFFLQLQEASS